MSSLVVITSVLRRNGCSGVITCNRLAPSGKGDQQAGLAGDQEVPDLVELLDLMVARRRALGEADGEALDAPVELADGQSARGRWMYSPVLSFSTRWSRISSPKRDVKRYFRSRAGLYL